MTEPVLRLGVMGSPIQHSRSPAIHLAAYQALSLPWSYEAINVGTGQLGRALGDLGPEWRGLSLTMPLKSEVLTYLDRRETLVDIVGAANTVLVERGRLVGFNTDVYGAQRMLAESIPETIRSAVVLGAGATARSVLAALAHGGTREVVVWSRSGARTGELQVLADRLDVSVSAVTSGGQFGSPDVVISTLPGTAELPAGFARELCTSAPLVDIAYDPWPSGVARYWLENGGGVVNNGLGMLLYQALAQVRIFVHGDPTAVLANEEDVLAAMRGAAFGLS